MGWLAAYEIDDVGDLIGGLGKGSLRAQLAAGDFGEGSLKNWLTAREMDDLICGLREDSLEA